jgi:hypothetical protein
MRGACFSFAPEQQPCVPVCGRGWRVAGLLACMAVAWLPAGWLQEQYTGAGVIRSRLTLMPGSWAGS